MVRPALYDSWLETAEMLYLEPNGVKTAFRRLPSASQKTYLFIHGVGGDFHGLVSLAYELRDDVQVLLVDLPCHGSSAMLPEATSEEMFSWARALLPALTDAGYEVTGVVAHSFGCAVASRIHPKRAWYLNPVLRPTAGGARYSAAMYKARRVIMWAYEWYPFAALRGDLLLHEKTKSAKSLVRWVTKHTKKSLEQNYAQAKIANEFMHTLHGALWRGEFAGVVVSTFDTMTDPVERQAYFDTFVALNAGHLSAFEMPEKLAALIRPSLRG